MLDERFWNKVSPEPNSGCWLWDASCSDAGYGTYRYNGCTRGAHRVAYENLVGPIPIGLQLDHKCFVRSCVNPEHLEPVTNQENSRRGAVAGNYGKRNRNKTHCKHGHKLGGYNLIIRKQHKTGGIHRKCRACKQKEDKQYKLKARQQQETGE